MVSALLTPEEFDAHVAAHTLRLSLVGMSNAGKSYRAKVLANESGFFWYQVDDDIQKTLGLTGQKEISAWIGYPTSEQYPEREETYLRLESEFTRNAAMAAHGKNLVFDTTGSVVHLETDILDVVKENTLVVHLDVGDESIEELVVRFFQDPKPVAWAGYFDRQPGESEESALRRNYPALLSERLKRYRDLAHLNVAATDLYDASGENTLAIIRNKL